MLHTTASSVDDLAIHGFVTSDESDDVQSLFEQKDIYGKQRYPALQSAFLPRREVPMSVQLATLARKLLRVSSQGASESVTDSATGTVSDTTANVAGGVAASGASAGCEATASVDSNSDLEIDVRARTLLLTGYCERYQMRFPVRTNSGAGGTSLDPTRNPAKVAKTVIPGKRLQLFFFFHWDRITYR